MSKANQLNKDLHKHREKQRTGQERPRTASSFLGSSLRSAEETLRTSRDAKAKAFSEASKRPLSEQQNITLDTLDFSQEFALHRDFKTRYASTPALRRRGVASARQKHFLGRVYHAYARRGE